MSYRSIYNLGRVRHAVRQWAEQARNGDELRQDRIRGYLVGAAQVLEEDSRYQDDARVLRGLLQENDPIALARHAERLAGGNSALFRRSAAGFIDQVVFERGWKKAAHFLYGGSLAQLGGRPVLAVLQEALLKDTPQRRQGETVAELRLIDAAERQAEVYARLHSGGVVPYEQGVLLSTGAFDTALGLYERHDRSLRSTADPTGGMQLCIAGMTRVDSMSPAYALRYTAGVHKRGLPINVHEGRLRYPHPFNGVAFPQQVTDGLRHRFEVSYWTPRGDQAAKQFRPEILAAMPVDSMTLFSTKSILPGGRMVHDIFMDSAQAARGNPNELGWGYILGFTGALKVFLGELPDLPGERRPALQVVYVTNRPDLGQRIAARLTQRDIADFTTPRDGLMLYTNPRLERPLSIGILDFNHNGCGDAMIRASAIKNSLTIWVGTAVRRSTFVRMVDNRSQPKLELVRDATDAAHATVRQGIDKLKGILATIYGYSGELLEVLEQDFVHSALISEDRIAWLTRFIEELSFTPLKEDDPESRKAMIDTAANSWAGRIRVNVAVTRNFAYGLSLDQGNDGVRCDLGFGLNQLWRRGTATEGLPGLINLVASLTDEEFARLDPDIIDLSYEVRDARRPTLITTGIFEKLSLLKGFMSARCTNRDPSQEQIGAHRIASIGPEPPSGQWRRDLRVTELTQTLRAFIHVLREGADEIEQSVYGRFVDGESRPFVGPLLERIDIMTTELERLAGYATRVDQETQVDSKRHQSQRGLSPDIILDLYTALSGLVDNIEKFSRPGDIEKTQQEIYYRLAGIFAYLREFRREPVPEQRTFTTAVQDIVFDPRLDSLILAAQRLQERASV